jgi:uncharacterized protein (DUF1697 family)
VDKPSTCPDTKSEFEIFIMAQYFAFLRAINVGGHTVKMDALRFLFAECGCSYVETFIASGNAIFESSEVDQVALTRRIEAHLFHNLGYAVAVFLRTPDEMTSIVGHQAFSNPEKSTIYIAFLPIPPDEKASEKLSAFNSTDNQFQLHGREVYWLCRTRFSDSIFSGAILEKTMGMQATIRNFTTIFKMTQKYIGPG